MEEGKDFRDLLSGNGSHVEHAMFRCTVNLMTVI
jgi:hypothetical protein